MESVEPNGGDIGFPSYWDIKQYSASSAESLQANYLANRLAPVVGVSSQCIASVTLQLTTKTFFMKCTSLH